jgi:hypothetical protein
MATPELSEQTIFTVTVLDLDHDSTQAELGHIAEALSIAARDMRASGGAKTAGEIIGHGGRVIGHWEFTPRAGASS